MAWTARWVRPVAAAMSRSGVVDEPHEVSVDLLGVGAVEPVASGGVFAVNAARDQFRGAPAGQVDGCGLVGSTVDDERRDGDSATVIAVIGVE
jgi:hypothetical protein